MENFLTIAPPTSKDGAALCAAALQQRGIILSPAEQAALAAAQTKALRGSGRVEFGAGILPALAKAFANSPYITQENAAALLEELQAVFYYFRGECDGLISDEKLVDFMRREFNGSAGGDMGYLSGTSLERFCARLKGKDTSYI